MKLPRNPVSSPYIQPDQLSAECSNNFDSIDVIAVGIGFKSYYSRRLDSRVRFIHQTTITSKDCELAVKEYNFISNVFCTTANETHSVLHGDSGELLTFN